MFLYFFTKEMKSFKFLKIYSVNQVWGKNSKSFSKSTSNFQMDKIVHPTIDMSKPTIGRTTGKFSRFIKSKPLDKISI